MKLVVSRHSLVIQPENDQDCAFIEDTLGLKKEGDFIYCIKSSDKKWIDLDHGLSYLQTVFDLVFVNSDEAIKELSYNIENCKEKIKNCEREIGEITQERYNWEIKYNTIKNCHESLKLKLKEQQSFWQKVCQLWH